MAMIVTDYRNVFSVHNPFQFVKEDHNLYWQAVMHSVDGRDYKSETLSIHFLQDCLQMHTLNVKLLKVRSTDGIFWKLARSP